MEVIYEDTVQDDNNNDLDKSLDTLASYVSKLTKHTMRVRESLNFGYKIHADSLTITPQLKKKTNLERLEKRINNKLSYLHKLLNSFDKFVSDEFTDLSELLEKIRDLRAEHKQINTDYPKLPTKYTNEQELIKNKKRLRHAAERVSKLHNQYVDKYNTKLQNLQLLGNKFDQEFIIIRKWSGGDKQLSVHKLIRYLEKYMPVSWYYSMSNLLDTARVNELLQIVNSTTEQNVPQ